MSKVIWFMEGLSSQRDILQAIKSECPDITVIASHRHERSEILSEADHSYIEPTTDEERLKFISDVVGKHDVAVIHAGRNCRWFEEHRLAIEKNGVKLVTGANNLTTFDIADNKFSFSKEMQANDLPVVPSIYIDSVEQLEKSIASKVFDNAALCVKPVTGIYGLGFWRLDRQVDSMKHLNDPDSRRIHPDIYIHSISRSSFSPMVLMPYLPGPERSVDMLIENGEVLAAVGRRKEGPIQHMECDGDAYHLAIKCAELLKADGLVNVQTRNDHNGIPVLLEINLRPSGGICYTTHSGVNLPALFAKWHLGLINKEQIKDTIKQTFSPAKVRNVTSVIPLN